MTTVRHEAHKVCVVARSYPRAAVLLWSAAALAAGVAGMIIVLGVLLLFLLVCLIHVFNRMWSPPILMSIRGDLVNEGEGRHARPEHES